MKAHVFKNQIIKAYHLIDRREKWYGSRETGRIPEARHCAWTAIITAYKDDPKARHAAEVPFDLFAVKKLGLKLYDWQYRIIVAVEAALCIIIIAPLDYYASAFRYGRYCPILVSGWHVRTCEKDCRFAK